MFYRIEILVGHNDQNDIPISPKLLETVIGLIGDKLTAYAGGFTLTTGFGGWKEYREPSTILFSNYAPEDNMTDQAGFIAAELAPTLSILARTMNQKAINLAVSEVNGYSLSVEAGKHYGPDVSTPGAVWRNSVVADEAVKTGA